jgi:ribosome-binding factor A
MEHAVSIRDPKKTLDSIGLGRQEQKRSTRVADAIRRELSELLLKAARDPKLRDVHITRVDVTDDLKIAKIYFSVFGDAGRIKPAENALQNAKGFMRTHIAKTLNMRFTPTLQFRHDTMVEKVEHIEAIFREIENERKVSGEDS